MKNILALMTAVILLASVMPVVLADGAGIDGGIIVNITEPAPVCNAPEVFIDHTARGWYPNDQTYYTAEYFGGLDEGGKYNIAGYDRYFVSERMNYVFTGETVDYYIYAEDADGDDDIASVDLYVGTNKVSPCAEVTLSPFDAAAFGTSYSSSKGNTYVCKLIVDSTWTAPNSVTIKVTDGADTDCTPVTITTGQIDWLNFNPTLAVTLDGTTINFGKVIPGETATSNAIKLKNAAEADSGVVMDMYIAADDYFTDPTNPSSICGAGNGIKYDKFSYYATKGSRNSGANNNRFSGLGEKGEGLCRANPDEFTTLPSHSGNINDMCRILNDWREASMLTQGASMSITFKLDLTDETAETCHGNFNNGQFHFVGRAI